jgi:hypothetical protein
MTTIANRRFAGFATTALVSGALAIGALFGSATATATPLHPGPGTCTRAHPAEGAPCGTPTADDWNNGQVSGLDPKFSEPKAPTAGQAIGGDAPRGGTQIMDS